MHNSSQTGKLFDRKFVANALRNTRCCPKCRSEYSYNYDLRMGDTHVKSNRPFLLTCGHNMCENCVYQNRQNLTCGVCQRPIDVPVNQRQFQNFHVRDFFDMNFFLLGELHHMRFYRRDSSVNNTMLANSQNYNSPTSPKSPAEAIAVLKCSECELEPALGLCRQCNVYYCKACYDSIHMYGKALKRHTLLSTHGNHGSAHLGMPRPSQCRRHHRLKDRYCRKCDLICCVLCAKADHNNHGWLSLLDENGRIKEEIATVLESVKISRENLRRAQKERISSATITIGFQFGFTVIRNINILYCGAIKRGLHFQQLHSNRPIYSCKNTIQENILMIFKWTRFGILINAQHVK